MSNNSISKEYNFAGNVKIFQTVEIKSPTTTCPKLTIQSNNKNIEIIMAIIPPSISIIKKERLKSNMKRKKRKTNKPIFKILFANFQYKNKYSSELLFLGTNFSDNIEIIKKTKNEITGKIKLLGIFML